MYRYLALFAFLCGVYTAIAKPLITSSELVGSWTGTTSFKPNDQTGVREAINVTFHENGTFDCSYQSTYYLLKTNREVVWATIDEAGNWTLEENVLTLRNSKLEIVDLQSEFPSITQASLEEAVKEQLAIPTIHKIQSFSNRTLVTFSSKEDSKVVLHKSDFEVTF